MRARRARLGGLGGRGGGGAAALRCFAARRPTRAERPARCRPRARSMRAVPERDQKTSVIDEVLELGEAFTADAARDVVGLGRRAEGSASRPFS